MQSLLSPRAATLVLSLAAAACHDPPDDPAPAPLDQRVQPVGVVVPTQDDGVATNTAVGALTGALEVGADGSATYAMPLWVPPGRQGVEPVLSLRYSSRAGNGLLGAGWALAGLGEIRPCARSWALDGNRRGGVRLDAQFDAFCLDGVRLVEVAPQPSSLPGACAVAAEYRTLPDSFARIIACAADAGVRAGPATFYVYTKDGRVRRYGGTDNSRLDGFDAMAQTPAKVRLGWLLDEERDRNGNTMSIAYTRVGIDQRPLRIDYTGGPLPAAQHLDFEYEGRGDRPRSSMAGQWFSDTQVRLKRLRARTGDAVQRTYELEYAASATTSRSRLAKVSACDGAGVCMAPTLLTYSTDSPGTQPWDVATPQQGGTVDPDYLPEYPLYFADFDGDGRDDMLFWLPVPSPGWWLRRSTGLTWGPREAQPTQQHTFGDSRSTIYDLNGDGMMDLVAAGPSGRPFAYLWDRAAGRLAPAAYTLPSSWGKAVHVVDVLGDGRPEYVNVSSGDRLQVYNDAFAATGRPLPTPKVLSSSLAWDQMVMRDLDSDGLMDFLEMHVNGINARTWTQPDGASAIFFEAVRGSNELARSPCTVWGDFTGDGMPDALDVSRGELYASTGRTMVRSAWWPLGAPPTPLPACGGLDPGFRAADVNADGLMDLLVLGRGPQPPNGAPRQVKALLSRYEPDPATGAMVEVRALPIGPVEPDQPPPPEGGGPAPVRSRNSRLVDINGDGNFDIFQMDSLTHFLLNVQAAPPADVLIRVEDGLGRKDSILYRTLANSDTTFTRCYQPGCFNGSMLAVYEVSRDTGIGNSGAAVLRHSYRDARVDRGGAGFLGFGRHDILDTRDGSVTRESYDLTSTAAGPSGARWYARHGMPAEVLSYVFDSSTPSMPKWRARRTRVNSFVSPTTAGGASFFTYALGTETRDVEDVRFDPAAPATWFDCGSPTCPGTLSYREELELRDALGNPVLEQTIRYVPGTTTSFLDSVTYTYDAPNDPARWLIGRPTTITATSQAPGFAAEPSRVTRLSYEANGDLRQLEREPAATDTRYQRTTLTRHPSGAVTQVVVAGATGAARTTTIGFDATYTHELSRTALTGDAAVPALTTSRVVHPGLGVALQSSDANGLVTEYDVDGFGRARTVRFPDGSTRRFRYGKEATYPLKVTATETSGQVTTTYRDRLGRDVRVRRETVSGNDALVDTSYDAFGRVRSVTRPYFAGASPIPYATQLDYDALSRPLRVGRHDTSAGTQPAISFLYSGTQRTAIDELGNMTRRIEDGAGHIVKTSTWPSGAWVDTHFTYGPFGSLRKVSDAAGNQTLYTFDSLGRATEALDPDTGRTRFEHDAFDEVAAVTDARGLRTESRYDGLGRLVERRAPDGVDRFVWDVGAGKGLGRLASSTRGAVSTTYGYDGAGRLLQELWSIDAVSYAYDYAYQATDSRLLRITYPSVAAGLPRFTVQYGYSATGLVNRVDDVTAPATPRLVWRGDDNDAEGRFLRETLGNNLVTTRSYHPTIGRLTRVTTAGIHDVAYAYNADETLAARTDYRNRADAAPVTRTESFTYDGEGRLLSATVPDRVPATYHYSYDALGNLQSASDQPACSDYVYGGAGYGPHQLARTTCFSTLYGHTYDAAGNETSTVAPDYRLQEWTSFHKQRVVTSRHGKMQYTYDANHRRVKKEKIPGTLPFLPEPAVPALNDGRSGVWGTTIYAGALYEKRTSNTPTIDHVFAVVVDGRTVAQRFWKQHKTSGGAAEEWSYLHTDFQGSPERVTGASGALEEVQSFDAWGGRRNPDWTQGGAYVPMDTRVGFTGHAYEDEFSDVRYGLIDMGGRSYDPFFRRFTSADPHTGMPLHGPSWNRYAYAWNSPLNWTDPSGYTNCPPEQPCPSGGGYNPIDTIKAIGKAIKSVDWGSVSGRAWGVAKCVFSLGLACGGGGGGRRAAPGASGGGPGLQGDAGEAMTPGNAAPPVLANPTLADKMIDECFKPGGYCTQAHPAPTPALDPRQLARQILAENNAKLFSDLFNLQHRRHGLTDDQALATMREIDRLEGSSNRIISWLGSAKRDSQWSAGPSAEVRAAQTFLEGQSMLRSSVTGGITQGVVHLATGDAEAAVSWGKLASALAGAFSPKWQNVTERSPIEGIDDTPALVSPVGTVRPGLEIDRARIVQPSSVVER